MNSQSFRFLEPHFLSFLYVCGFLFLLCLYRMWSRMREARRYRASRVVSKEERIGRFGSTPFYAIMVLALAWLVMAAARPQVETTKTFAAGNIPIDIIVIKDGSASQLIKDVFPDRWQRSIRFVRVLASELRWKGDRMALAVFAEKAAPQVRLTTDVNVLLFALDHIEKVLPFPLSEREVWDTNIAEGIRWGAKLANKDEELYGKSGNAQGIVVISDGVAWDGDVMRSIKEARARNMPIYVVGVGTERGGYIPDSEKYSDEGRRIESRADTGLDRKSLDRIAKAGSGEYFELGQRSDADIAQRIVAGIRRGGALHSQDKMEEHYEDIYWFFLLAAGICFTAGLLTLV